MKEIKLPWHDSFDIPGLIYQRPVLRAIKEADHVQKPLFRERRKADDEKPEKREITKRVATTNKFLNG